MNRSTSANTSDMITQAFGSDCVVVPIASILPVKAIEKTTKSSHKYRQIAASIREIGLVEPPVVIGEGLAYSEVYIALQQAEKTLARPINTNLMATREWLKKLKSKSPFVTKILDQPKLFVFGTEDELRALK